MRSLLAGVAILVLGAWAAPAGAATITEFALPEGSTPGGIVAGPDGALWFTDRARGRIGRITTAGEVSDFGLPAPAPRPWSIAAGEDALFWSERETSRIGRLELDGDARSVSTQACAITCSEGVRWPNDIAVAPDGSPWFSVDVLFPVDAAGARGQAHHEICSLGARLEPGECTKVDRVGVPSGHATGGPALGPDGAMWFTNKALNIVGRIATSGPREIRQFGLARAHDPESIAAGPDGALWFTERNTPRVTRITTAGHVTAFALPRGDVWPADISAGPDGAVWVTESGSSSNAAVPLPSGESRDAVARITPAGVITEFPLPNPGSRPRGIVAGPDGAIWFAEDGGRIGRLTLDGTGGSTPTGAAADPAPSSGADRVLRVKPRRFPVPPRGRRALAISLDLGRRVTADARLQSAMGSKRRTLARVKRTLVAGRRSLRLPLPRRGLRPGRLQVVVELRVGRALTSRTTFPVVAVRRR